MAGIPANPRGGAGALVLEAPDHALAPGAMPAAEVLGYGISADTYDITSGPKDGEGAYRSMQLALGMAGLEARQAQYLNAHATPPLMGDRGEVAAISRVFGDGAAVGAVFTVLSLRDRLCRESWTWWRAIRWRMPCPTASVSVSAG